MALEMKTSDEVTDGENMQEDVQEKHLEPTGWLHRLFLPSHHNNFEPRIIARRGLLTMLSLMITAEGFLVVTMVSRQTGVHELAAAGMANASTLAAVQAAGVNLSVRATMYFLSALASLLILGTAFALIGDRHAGRGPRVYLGAMVAICLALGSLLVTSKASDLYTNPGTASQVAAAGEAWHNAISSFASAMIAPAPTMH